MSKGWTRRPSLVDRKDFDAAWEATFRGEVESERACECWRFESTVCDICQGVDPENPGQDVDSGAPEGGFPYDQQGNSRRPREPMSPFDIAEIMEPEGNDWRRA